MGSFELVQRTDESYQQADTAPDEKDKMKIKVAI